MKKMIYNIPLATLGILMNGQKVKVGYWNIFADKFEDDLPIYEGPMGDLMFGEDGAKFANMKMKKVNHMSAENDVVVIGVDKYDVN